MTEEQKSPVAVFMEMSPGKRVEMLKEMPDPERYMLKRSMSPEQTALHISNFPIGSEIGPFGVPVPDGCMVEQFGSATGFGTYEPVKDCCVDCTHIIECFARGTGTAYDVIVRTMKEEQTKVRSAKSKAVKSTPASDKAPVRIKVTEKIKPAKVDMTVNTMQDIYRLSDISPKGNPDRFFEGNSEKLSGVNLIKLSRKTIAMPKPQYPGGKIIGQALYHDVQGPEKAAYLSEYFKIVVAAIGQEKAPMFVLEAVHGGLAPSGWLFYLTAEDKIWCEFINPSNALIKEDVQAIVRNAGQ